MNNNQRLPLILLAVITIIGLGLRLWQVESLPAILNRDEAALAYNAKLLLETGQDEWGQSWPLTLQSFGDYKLPGYPWLLLGSFSIFGFNDWAVRIPSVLAGTTLILLAYYLAKKLNFSEKQSLFTSLLVAISPVFVVYSRSAYEANVALSLLVGALLLLFSLREKFSTGRLLGLIGLLLLAVFTYNTPLLLLPGLMVVAGLIFAGQDRVTLTKLQLSLLVVLGLGLALLLPVASQKSGITLFTDATVRAEWLEYRSTLDGVSQALLGNRLVYLAGRVGENVAQSFSPHFLISNGGSHPWHSLPGMGHIYAVSYVLAALGMSWTIADVWRARNNWRAENIKIALLFLLIFSLVPAIITVDAPHATRSLLFLFLLQIFAVAGLGGLLAKLSDKSAAILWQLTLAGIVFSAGLFTYRLFTVFPTQQHVFQAGFDRMIAFTEQRYPEEEIAVVDPDGYHYILLAWYLKLPADQYFTSVMRQDPNPIGFRYGEQLGRYHFIAQPADQSPNERILIQWSEAEQAWKIQESL